MERRRQPVRLAAAVAIGTMMAAGTYAASVEVDAVLEPELVGVGQLVTLTLEVRVDGSTELELEPSFSLENLAIVAGPAQSQQVSFVNGRVSRSQSLRWTLQPQQVGKARVKELRLAVNDEVFTLAEQVLEVQEEPVEQVDAFGRPSPFGDPFQDLLSPFGRQRRPRPAEPKLFLRAEASPRKPFVGEQILYSLLLFTQADIGAVEPDDLPDFEGFWAVDIEQPQRPKSVMTEIQGERYGRVVLLQKALFPLRPGSLRIEPIEAKLIAKIPETSWLGTIGSYNREYSLASNAIDIEARPLPDPPPAFRGAVGSFEIETTLDPRELEVGEAASLTVRLSGRGRLQGLAGPPLPELAGMRTFPPEQSARERAGGTTVRGEKTWTWVLIPEAAGAWEIPSIDFVYFDPRRESYETVSTQPKVLLARAAGPVPAQPPPVAPATVAEPPETSEERPAPGGPGWRRFTGAGAGLALAATALTLLGRRFQRSRRTRRLRVRLRGAADSDPPRRVAQIVEEAWREFLADRWEIAPSVGAGEWAQHLAARGVAPAAVESTQLLARELNYLRYAPELSAHDTLRREIVELSLRLAKSLA